MNIRLTTITGKRLRGLFPVIVFLLLFPGAAINGSFSFASAASGTDQLIKQRLTEWKTGSKAVIGGERIYSDALVDAFYERRNYQPVWSQAVNLSQIKGLIGAVEESYNDGLRPADYHLVAIRALVERAGTKLSPDPVFHSDMDILLTDAFLTLGCHLSGGCSDPVTVKEEWHAKRGNVDVSSALDQAVGNGRVREALMGLRPERDAYKSLRQALARYRAELSKGDWPQVSAGPPLKLQSVSGRVLELRRRLAASGELVAGGEKGGELFDEKLQQSVVIFQKRHGLKADGAVGPSTLEALNVSLKQRIRQIELNMERLRWILSNEEQRFIVVNIANFEMNVIENGKSVLSMKVVVGMPSWNTPVFTATMTHIIINPSWSVPDSIARKEILNKVRKDAEYFSKQNMEVLRGWGPNEEIIDPDTIDWSKISAKTLPYRFRQEPGPLNPLGRLKFVLPNKFDVYLHDTSARSLFSKDVRTLSHGCTRIEKPQELAEYLLRDDPRWSRKKISAAISRGTERQVTIPHPLNVHFLYLTAWVDEDGSLQFRKDIYERDKSLDLALMKRPSVD